MSSPENIFKKVTLVQEDTGTGALSNVANCRTNKGYSDKGIGGTTGLDIFIQRVIKWLKRVSSVRRTDVE